MTSPSWPFSDWPSSLGWDAVANDWNDTQADEAAAIIAASPRRAAADWQPVTHYELETPHGLGTVRPLGRYWYASIVTDGATRAIGEPYRSDAEAMAAVEQAISELAADS
jgi:hypothetical protein